MRIILAVFLNKLITNVCKLFKRNGSVYPGYIIYDWFDKKVLTRVKYPKTVIAITGSSGKGSTTNVIAHILRDAGVDFVYNESGSNGVLAATTLILNNCNYKGEFKHDVLLLECDERHLKLIFSKNKMTHLIVTNVTRDQPARNGHPDIVFKDIVDAIDDSTNILINADDPLVNRLSYEFKNVKKYGIDKTNDSYTTTPLVSDYAYCPICHKKLNYSFYHYGHIGSYSCPNKDFSRGNLDYEVTNLDLNNSKMLINNKEVRLDKDVLYAAYYTLAAYGLCNMLGFSDDTILYALNKDKQDAKRGKTYKINNRDLIMLESKNENNLSYYQSMKYIVSNNNIKTVILGFENVSRRYKFNDLSWLWDVDFELLNNKCIDSIVVIGRFKYDILTRLSYAGIDKNKIILVDNVNEVLNVVKEKTKGTIYTMVCFDMTSVIKGLLKGENNEGN